jgi:DNA-binding GntR family transcriptional regulator
MNHTSPHADRGEADIGQHVFRSLRRRIISGELAPGAQLHELGLAAELGVSRNRLREAFTRLEVIGLVDRPPNRGAFVHRLTVGEAREIFEARIALEGMCARLAASNVEPSSWEDLLEFFGPATEAMIEEGDLEAYLRHVAILRRRMMTAANNQTIVSLLVPLLDRSAVAMRRVILATNRASDGLVQYRAVLDALRAGDADRAEALKRAQLREAWSALERYHRLVL